MYVYESRHADVLGCKDFHVFHRKLVFFNKTRNKFKGDFMGGDGGKVSVTGNQNKAAKCRILVRVG